MKGMKSKILCSHAAGDRGFDPLRLAANPSTRPWLVEGELYNGCAATPCESPQLFCTPRPYMAATDTHMKWGGLCLGLASKHTGHAPTIPSCEEAN